MAGETPWTVTQADVDRAHALIRQFPLAAQMVMLEPSVVYDEFARHRHEATAPLVEALEEARKGYAIAVGVCEAAVPGWMGLDAAKARLTKIDTLLTQIRGEGE